MLDGVYFALKTFVHILLDLHDDKLCLLNARPNVQSLCMGIFVAGHSLSRLKLIMSQNVTS